MKNHSTNSKKSITRREALKNIAAGAATVAAAPFFVPSFASASAAKRNHHITLAMVGGAHIHAPDFANRMAAAENVTTKYVWDPSRETAQTRRDVTGGEIAENVSQIASDPEVDGVVICSQTNLHVDLVPELARAGKHLFIEKPVGLNGDEAAAIANTVNESGVIFQTGYFMRSQAANLKIKQLIKDGALGEITRLRLSNVHSGAIGGWFDGEWRWMADTEQAGVGAFGDLGSHVFDLLLWFMEDDRPSACTGYIDTVLDRYPGCDEYGEGMVRFESGAVATVAGGWVDHANPNQVEISGTKGHLRVTNGRLYLRIPAMDADASQAWDDLPDSLKHPIELFFDAVAGAENVPLITADEAAKVNNLVTQIYNAHEQGVWVEL
ncbi:MAG: Gfo/Idh/MocA family oxidoreductase [Balneolaceae bacterium]|nr:Gfo/Idh/MocA family oxidoreductase [Balneolaceae bacterium]